MFGKKKKKNQNQNLIKGYQNSSTVEHVSKNM